MRKARGILLMLGLGLGLGVGSAVAFVSHAPAHPHLYPEPSFHTPSEDSDAPYTFAHLIHTQLRASLSGPASAGGISNIEVIAYNQSTNSLVLECDVDSLEALEFANSPIGPIVKRVRAKCLTTGPLTIEVGDRVTVLQSRVLGVRAWDQRTSREVLNALHTRLLLGSMARIRFSRPVERLSPLIMSQIQVPVYSIVNLPAPVNIQAQEQPGRTGLLVIHSAHESVKPGDFIVGYNKLRSTGKLYSVESISNWNAFIDSYAAEDGVRLRLKKFTALMNVATSRQALLDTDIHLEVESAEDNFPLANVPITELSVRNSRPRQIYQKEDAFQSLVEKIWKVRSPRELDAIVRPVLNNTRKDYEIVGQNAFQNFLTSAMRKAHMMGYDRVSTGYFEFVYPKHLIPTGSQWDLQSLQAFANSAHNSSHLVQTSTAVVLGSFSSPNPNPAQQLLMNINQNSWKTSLKSLRRYSPPAPDDYCCAAAVKSYGRNKNFQGALDVLARLDVWNKDPGPNTLAALLGTLAKADSKKWWTACEVIFARVPRYMPYTLYHLTTMMTYHLNRQEYEKVFLLFNQIKHSNFGPNDVAYNILVRAYMEMKQNDNAFKLIKRMANQRVPVTTTTYNQILKAYVNQHNLKGMVEVLEAMGRYNVQLDGSSYGHLIEGFYNARKWPNVISTYQTMMASDTPIHPYVFGKVLSAFSEMRDAYGALNAFKEFLQRGFHPHRSHFSAVMNACVRGGAPELAEQLFPEMSRRGLEPDLINLYVLAKAQVWQLKFDDAQGIVIDVRRNMERGQTQILERMYSALITGLCASSQWRRAENVLDECLSVLRPGAALTYCLATLPVFFPIEKSTLLDTAKLKKELLSQLQPSHPSPSGPTPPFISKQPTQVLRFMVTSCERIFRRQPRIRDPLYRMILKRCVVERNAPLAQLVLGWKRQGKIKVLDEPTHIEGVYSMELSARALVRSALLPDPLAENGDTSINWDAVLASPSVGVSIDSHGNPQLLLPKDEDSTQDSDKGIPEYFEIEADFYSRSEDFTDTPDYDTHASDTATHHDRSSKQRSMKPNHGYEFTYPQPDLRRDMEDLRRFYNSRARASKRQP